MRNESTPCCPNLNKLCNFAKKLSESVIKMELMHLFKRQKSSGKLGKKEEKSGENIKTDLQNVSFNNNTADGNGNSRDEAPSNHAHKEKRGWRKSFRKLRTPKQETNATPDEIAVKQRCRSDFSSLSDYKSRNKSPNSPSFRWSYSPGYVEDRVHSPEENHVIEHRYEDIDDPKPNDAEQLIQDNSGCHPYATEIVMKSRSTGNLKERYSSYPDPPPDGVEFPAPENYGQILPYALAQDNEDAFSSNEGFISPSSYENEADNVLDNMNEEQTYEEQKSDDNLSWATNEFDSDSDDYDNDLDLIATEHDNSNRNDEAKDNFITKRVRKLKFLEKRTGLQKKFSKDEQSIFVDLHLNTERYAGPQLQPPSADLLPYQLRRRKIVETIIQSESSYIDSLERLEISYKKVLLESKPSIISSDMVERIFYKIGNILQCHQLFQIALASAVNTWDEHETIGDTFVASFSKSMVLECYSSYINNFTEAMETVRKTCVRKPQFLAFLRDRQNESQNRINLYGLMLKPVQRFPQFILLVQDLLKNTPNDHADRLPLQLALTELEILAEHLNQRRADDEEKSEMIQLIESSNIKLINNFTKDGRTRRLLKKGLVRECTYSEDGTLEKDRECLLVLTNDMLLSCSCTNRRQLPSGIATFRDLYKLKWCATLDIVKITDGHFTSVLDYHKMKTDEEILEKISQLVDGLNFSYDALQVNEIKSEMTSLKRKVVDAESAVNQSTDSFKISFPQKSGDFKRTLMMSDSVHCNEWMDSIINAKLANDHKNLHCWYSADGSDGEFLWKPPMFLDSFDCVSKQKTLQVQCAHAFMPTNHYTLLWLACSASTVVAVVNIYQIMHEKIEKVHVMQVESSVQCMEDWNPCSDEYSLWLGMECGSLIEFSTETPYSKMNEITMPTMSTVMIMRGFERNLYVGLLDGSLLMYNRPEGTRDLYHVHSVAIGNGPLNCLSLLDGKLWGASGNDIITMNASDMTVESMNKIETEQPLTVSHIVQVGSGLWVAFCDTCSLHLYHLETLKLLQDLNLSRPVRDFFQSLGWLSRLNQTFFVTCLWSSYWQLFVGTSNGLILAMPLPKLAESVPKITGPCRICYHMLNGPVTFLCAPSMPVPKTYSNASTDEISLAEKSPLSSEFETEASAKVPNHATLNADLKTLHKPLKSKHKRTASDGRLNICDQAPISSVSQKRFSSVEPYLSTNPAESVQIQSLLRPLPSSPEHSRRPGEEVSCEELLEDDIVYTKKDVEDIKTPTNTLISNLHLNESRWRNFPSLIACGEGYNFHKNSDSPLISSERATTLLCWKINI